MSVKKTSEKIPQYFDIDKLPIVPNQMGIAISPYGILISFYHVPPEDSNKSFVLARVLLEESGALTLIDGLKDAVNRLKKDEKQPQPKSAK